MGDGAVRRGHGALLGAGRPGGLAVGAVQQGDLRRAHEAKLRYDVDNYLWLPNSVGADFRVKGCQQDSHAEKHGLDFLAYGNKLGGFVSDGRFRASQLRSEERMKLQARLVHITQMNEA